MPLRSKQRKTQLPGPLRTSNDEFFDALLRHQIGLMLFASSLGRRLQVLLDAVEADLRDKVRRGLSRFPASGRGLTTPSSVRRLERLLADVRRVRLGALQSVEGLMIEEMSALVLAEPKFVQMAFQTVIPVRLSTGLPASERLKAIVSVHPFEGKILRDWARDIRRADIERIEAQIRIGMVQGESIPDISRRITGSARLRGRNGVTEITRRQAQGLARTATNAIATEARNAFFLANREFFDAEIYVATLDSRTTPICRSLDGTRYKVGEGRYPPLHWNCRSIRVPLLDADPLGNRPSKPVHQRELLREFAKQRGIDPPPALRKNLPYGTKGAFDAFARRRTRQMIGVVPAKTTYEDWLRRQPAAFQDDVLGNTKGRLFRRGDLSLDRFVDSTDAEKTLADLARSDAEAFRLAGLDPDDFL